MPLPSALPATDNDRHLTFPLHETLAACALPENEIQRGIHTLLYSPARSHALGVLGAYGGWLRHLRQYSLLAYAS